MINRTELNHRNKTSITTDGSILRNHSNTKKQHLKNDTPDRNTASDYDIAAIDIDNDIQTHVINKNFKFYRDDRNHIDKKKIDLNELGNSKLNRQSNREILLTKDTGIYDPKRIRKALNGQYHNAINEYDYEDNLPFEENNESIIDTNIIKRFLIVFAIILATVALSFGLYKVINHSDSGSNGNIIITPSVQQWKENASNNNQFQDKLLYDIVGPHDKKNSDLKYTPEPQLTKQSDNPNENNNIEEYTVIDKIIYYVKIHGSDNVSELKKQAMQLKQDNKLLSNKIAIKTVVDLHGKQKDTILIGPFSSDTYAKDVATSLGVKCTVIKTKA